MKINLNETQLNILQSIEAISKSKQGAAVTSHDVAASLNLERELVEHHLDYFKERNFIKLFCRSNSLSTTSTHMCELTKTGKIALTNPDELNT